MKPVAALPSMGTNETAIKAADSTRELMRKTRSEFADGLRVELAALVAYELEITVQVGVMLAANVSQSQILHTLGIDSNELKVCRRRLQQVASKWLAED